MVVDGPEPNRSFTYYYLVNDIKLFNQEVLRLPGISEKGSG
jgi:hypothetical protein